MDSNRYEEDVYYKTMEDELPVSWIDQCQFEGDADKTTAKDQVLDTRVHTEGTRTSKDEVKSALKQIRKKEENELESVNEIVSSGKGIPAAENGKETAIEREIRLSREREAELKREQDSRLKERQHASQSPSSSMPIRKVPEPMKIEHSGHVTKEAVDAPPALPMSPVPDPRSVYHQLTEVDRDSVIRNSESIVDIEIREQQEREKALLKAGYIKQQTVDKEAEQSEFERREKEHERVQAHESVIDREIRIQQERERELQLLRQIVTSGAKQGQDKAAPAPSQQPQQQQQQQQQQKTQPQQQIAQDTSPTARERAMASSPEPKPQPAHSEVVSYESALSTKSHEGESLIARELREQKEREAELRQRYKEMGLGNLLHNEDPPDTPFNAPEPPQPNISKLPARAKATLKSNTARGMSRSVSEPVKIEANNQSNVHSQNEHVPQSVSQDMISQQTIAEEPRTPKVHPLDEPDLSDTAYKFAPQNETPIEREMRLAREREEELRRARGYPKLVSDPGAIIEIKEITTPMPKPHTLFKKGDEGDGKLMQKFASSRLQSEIEKEKRREQDLKQQGKISTLSSERDSGHQKYVDVIPKENIGANKQPNWKVQNAAARAVSPSHSVDSVDSSSQQPGGEQNGTTAAHHQAEPTARAKPEPPVLRRFVSHTATDTYNGRPSPHLAESRIEKELREMKEREEELRNLRRSISAMQSGDGELTNNTSNGQLQEKTLDEPKHNQSSNTVKATRRKSALAEEWERKFGASN